MSVLPMRSAVLLATVAVYLGCGGDPPGVPDGGVRAADGGDGRGPPPAMRSGSVYGSIAGTDGGVAPIAGATVCVLDRPDIGCITADQEGSYTFTLPPTDKSGLHAVHFSAPGYLGRVRPAGDTWWPGSVTLLSHAEAEAKLAKAGFSYPPRGSAFIELHLFDGSLPRGVAGATATLSPASGSGAIYGGEDHLPDRTLTATSATGIVFFGNIAPGRVTINVAAGDRTCGTYDVSGTWRGSANALAIPVAPDAVTDGVTLWCR
jgi:hypothetical protein